MNKLRKILTLKNHLRRKKASVDKLHIGCGSRKLPGWINIDIDEKLNPDMVLDVTKGLPFPDNSILCIHSEDFIEHVPLEGGKSFLAECLRVLEPDGVLRIVTPDLNSLVLAYSNRDPRAMAWYKETFDCRTFGELFNLGMRMAGHTFLYDRETLSLVLEEAGFVIRETEYQQSEIEDLKNLDVRGDGVHIYYDCYKR